MDHSGNQLLLRGNQPGAADRMRELLARTIQDHVADERSNAIALEEIRERLEGLELTLKEVREREVPGLGAHLDGLAARVDDARDRPPGWAESLAEHMDLLGGQLKPVGELPAMWVDVGTVSENVDQMLPRLQMICDTISQALDALRASDEHLFRLGQNVGQLQQSMEAAASRFGRLDKAIAELSQRATHLDKEMSVIKGRADHGFAAITAKVDHTAEGLAGQMNSHAAALAEVTAGVIGLGSQVELLGGQIQLVHGRVERLDDRIGDTDDRIAATDAGLTAAIAEVDAKLIVVDTKVANSDAKVGALDTRLERLDERLDDSYDRLCAIDNILAALDGRFGERLAALDSRLDERLTGHDRGLAALDGRIATMNGKLGPVDSKLSALDIRLSAVDAKTGSLAGKLEGLPELEGRLAAASEESVAKIVEAAQHDLTGRLCSLEETVLTLAEALLRPSVTSSRVAVPPPHREGTRI